MLARSAGRGSPPKTEPLAPAPKFPGSIGPGLAVLASGTTRSRHPRARARGSRNGPGSFRLRARAPGRGSRPILAPELRTAGSGPGPRNRLPRKQGPAPVFREDFPDLPLGPGRRGAVRKSANLGFPNAWPGGKNHTKSVDGDVAHHANANCQPRGAGGRGEKGPIAKCCLSPEKPRL